MQVFLLLLRGYKTTTQQKMQKVSKRFNLQALYGCSKSTYATEELYCLEL